MSLSATVPHVPPAAKPKKKPKPAPAAAKTNPPKTQGAPASQPPKPAPAASSSQPGKTESSQRQSSGSQRQQCSQCEDSLAEARDLFSREEKTRHAYSKVVSVLGSKHQRDSRHETFVNEGLELIVQQLQKSLTPGQCVCVCVCMCLCVYVCVCACV